MAAFHTSGPSARISAGASPPPRHHPFNFPKCERTPARDSTFPATMWKAVAALSFVVITYKSSRKLRILSDGWSSLAASTRATPFQFALQTRAGTEALAHILQFTTDRDPEAVFMSLDGVGAFDHVKRAAFLQKLRATPELQSLLPLVRMLYSTDSQFFGTDDQGDTHTIPQGEGGEQGCPLMPALYALAQHDALVEAANELHPSDMVLSFLTICM